MSALLPLVKNQPQTSFLITYSQVDPLKIVSKEDFSHAVLSAFQEVPGSSVEYWCTSEEAHEELGFHYHMVVKLKSARRWKAVKDALFEAKQIVVHFAVGHATYKLGFDYVCKEDPNPLKSDPHPHCSEIGNSNRNLGKRKHPEEDTPAPIANIEVKAAKKKRLSAGEIRKFIIQEDIRSSTHLMAIAQERSDAGEDDLADYCMNLRSEAKVTEVIDMAWMLFDAKKKMDRRKKSRIDLIKEAAGEDCPSECNGKWLVMAEEVITQNGFTVDGFSHSLYDLLKNGRQKYKNILIMGPANCGKTFILSPLQEVFSTFANPAQNKYAWLGAEDAEIIFLNDFRWSPEVIEWQVLLNLLEGSKVNLPAPKNHYSKDITVSSDVPIFATSIDEIVKTNGDPEKRQQETYMMAARWKVFQFSRQIEEEKQKKVPCCKKCFSQLVLRGEPKPKRTFTFKRVRSYSE